MKRLDQISYLRCALEARIDCSERTFSAQTSQNIFIQRFHLWLPSARILDAHLPSPRLFYAPRLSLPLRTPLIRSTFGAKSPINVSSETVKPITTEAGR